MTDEQKALVARLIDTREYHCMMYSQYDTVTEAADTIEAQAREIERLREALENIASQQQVHEMTAWDREHADFDEAYDLIIYEARAALEGTSND